LNYTRDIIQLLHAILGDTSEISSPPARTSCPVVLQAAF